MKVASAVVGASASPAAIATPGLRALRRGPRRRRRAVIARRLLTRRLERRQLGVDLRLQRGVDPREAVEQIGEEPVDQLGLIAGVPGQVELRERRAERRGGHGRWPRRGRRQLAPEQRAAPREQPARAVLERAAGGRHHARHERGRDVVEERVALIERGRLEAHGPVTPSGAPSAAATGRRS
jgi:hypothetical protein